MTAAAELLRQGRTAEMWQKYCRFVELKREEYTLIQERLLLEQLELLNSCALGQHLMRGARPTTVEEFRRVVPLTTYHDYLPFLGEKREDTLPAPPVTWVRTSGRTGEFPCKWAPVTRPYYQNLGHYFLGTQILSGARHQGDVNLEEGNVYLYTAAPPPFLTGIILRAGREEFPFRFVPSIEEAEGMDFQERMEKAFLMAMETGVDYFLGVGSVLVAMGEAFSKGSGRKSASRDMLKPAALARSLKALAVSKLRGEPLQPRHFWKPKGITVGGMDVQVYRKRIESLWGVRVFEGYGCAEFGNIAVQSWGARSAGMIPSADCGYWEFVPEAEYYNWKADRSYQPQVLLATEVTPGRYVLVGTSLLGGAFVRYVIGDLVRVLNTRDPELGIDLPQIVVESRADDLIDLGSMVWLTERSLWQAFAHLEYENTNWVVRKEMSDAGEPLVHLFIEDDGNKNGQLANEIHGALVETMPDYKMYFGMTGANRVRVTPLAPGTFAGYMAAKRAEGAELGHLKPPRMQPADKIMQQLLTIHAEKGGDRLKG